MTLKLLILTAASALFSSCAMMEQAEKPIRPTSENSNIAHGQSTETGGALGGIDAFSR